MKTQHHHAPDVPPTVVLDPPNMRRLSGLEASSEALCVSLCAPPAFRFSLYVSLTLSIYLRACSLSNARSLSHPLIVLQRDMKFKRKGETFGYPGYLACRPSKILLLLTFCLPLSPSVCVRVFVGVCLSVCLSVCVCVCVCVKEGL
jgi:hypothetical protein